MKTYPLPTPLRGIIPPLVTPLLEQDELDAGGLERLIEHVIEGGVHGLFILGTTGEAPSLSYRLRRELIDRACRQVNGRIPVLVGITDTAFTESVHMAECAAERGASGVVLAPPYYFPAGQPELMEYLERLLPHIPLPLLLYNMPSHTKVLYEPDTVRRALDLEGVVGLKDSSGDMVYFHTLQTFLRERPDFSLLIGPEELLGETVLLGGHGGVNGGANLFPRLYVEQYEAASAGNRSRVAELQDVIMRISLTIYRTGRHSSSILKGLKCALELEGLCGGFIAEPFSRFHEPERDRIRDHLAGIKPRVEAVLARAS
jgi:dihydrodipicolinate synthase/N-acetylneuraminate lyase